MTCSICKIDKKEDDFYSYDRWRCKKCRGKKVLAWKAKNRERSLEIDKKHRDTHKFEKRKYYAKWYKKNGRIRNVLSYEITLQWKQEHPDAIKAHRTLQYAVKTGKVIKPNICLKCYREKRLSAHHNNYSKPLEVEWLCYSCHKLRHFSS